MNTTMHKISSVLKIFTFLIFRKNAYLEEVDTLDDVDADDDVDAELEVDALKKKLFICYDTKLWSGLQCIDFIKNSEMWQYVFI